jgi:hypothetical protein
MRLTVITLLSLVAPRAALACPVCFGQNDSPLASGMNLGIIVMLGVTLGVLAAFASFMIHLMRRARAAAGAAPRPAVRFAGEGAGAESGQVPRAQGGMV